MSKGFAFILPDLVLNLTLLVALTVLSGFVEKRLPRARRLGILTQGLLFGAAALLGMARPLVFGPGLIFDGRSVMISLCALYFGPLAGALSALPAIAYRLALGGSGALTGCLVILSSVLIGVAAAALFRPQERPPAASGLLAFGLVVNLAMLALMLTLPGGAGPGVVARIGPTVILVYPLATILAGKILSDQVESGRTLAALRESEERFKLSMEATSDGIWDLDIAGGGAYYSPGYYRMLGYEPGEFPAAGSSWAERVHPEDREGALSAQRDCIEGGKDHLEVEFRMLAKDGAWRWFFSRGKCIARGPDGRALRLVGTHVDITERKEAEEALRRGLREKEVLLSEVHHRVKNNLTVVSSLLHLQALEIRSPEDAVAAFQNSIDRIGAMALAHEELYDSRDYARVDMRAYLDRLVRQLAIANGAEGRIALSVGIEEIALSVSASIPCGLILTELVTNAFKYAFPRGRSGELRVSLRRLEDDSLELSVADDGIGLPTGLDAESGGSFGLSLVRLLVIQLEGSLEFSGEKGAEIRVRFRDRAPP